MRRRRLGLLLAIATAVAVVAGVVISQNQSRRSAPPVTARSSPIISPAFPVAAVAPPGWRVVSADLKIDLPIVEGDGWSVGLNQAALYPGMKWPGENGRSLIYAHARAGMFGPLLHATVGQRVDVVRPGRPTLHYVIRQYFPRWNPGDLTYTKPADHDELVLLTCTTYNANDPRVLAVAELSG